VVQRVSVWYSSLHQDFVPSLETKEIITFSAKTVAHLLVLSMYTSERSENSSVMLIRPQACQLNPKARPWPRPELDRANHFSVQHTSPYVTIYVSFIYVKLKILHKSEREEKT